MRRILLELNDDRRSFMSSSSTPPPYLTAPPPPPPQPQSSGFNLNNKVSPSILIIIIILAIIFLISSLLHLLVRLLLRNPNHRNPNDEMQNVTAFQGQLQQLFHMHDSGVDQSFIESTLPTFHYKAIVGVKDPFDCAVCLCEFEPEDNLRLLPKCSHAFHIDCIDTWLLSHSTCPLCRTCLLSDYSPNPNASPIVFLLESQSESSREIVSDRDLVRENSHLSVRFDDDDEVSNLSRVDRQVQDLSHQSESNDDKDRKTVTGAEEKVVSVKLGKFKNVGEGVGGGNNNGDYEDVNSDARRCFSMGSFAYVMDENSSFQVSVRAPQKKVSKKKYLGSLMDRRAAVSECDCESRRDFNGFEAFRILDEAQCNEDTNAIGGNKSARFSISKMWFRGKKDNKVDADAIDLSRRTSSSFRFSAPEPKAECCERTVSEIATVRCEKEAIESSFGEEIVRQRCKNILDESEANVPSFGRRTLAWLMGRENKAAQSNSYGNV